MSVYCKTFLKGKNFARNLNVLSVHLCCVTTSNALASSGENPFTHFHSTCSPLTKKEINTNFEVLENFINEEEEENLVQEVHPYLKRLKYEVNHWDDAIHGYRETEKSKWSSKCSPILERWKKKVFKDNINVIASAHVLDLSPEGVIKPHVDSVRFCGNIISGLCLLSDAVMRLVKEKEKDQIVDIFLPRRALYIMKDDARYKYTHEILGQDTSYFGSKIIKKGRRISIICRNHAPS